MKDATRGFTVIDFLGIFIPGAIFALACQFYGIDLVKPFQSFFGEGSPLLGIYFVMIGYLIGTLLHDMSGAPERWGYKLKAKKGCQKGMMCKLFPSYHDEYWSDLMKERYKQRFGGEAPTSAEEYAECGRNIFHLIQIEYKTGKVMMFSAFYALSRTMALTLFLVGVLMVTSKKQEVDCKTMLVLLLVILLCILHSRKYQQLRIKYAYTIFLTAPDPQNPKD